MLHLLRQFLRLPYRAGYGRRGGGVKRLAVVVASDAHNIPGGCKRVATADTAVVDNSQTPTVTTISPMNRSRRRLHSLYCFIVLRTEVSAIGNFNYLLFAATYITVHHLSPFDFGRPVTGPDLLGLGTSLLTSGTGFTSFWTAPPTAWPIAPGAAIAAWTAPA